MTAATWSQLGESLDRTIAAVRSKKSRPSPKTVAHRQKKHEGEARARELHQGRCEQDYEEEMNERIQTLGAEIRAENMRRLLD